MDLWRIIMNNPLYVTTQIISLSEQAQSSRSQFPFCKNFAQKFAQKFRKKIHKISRFHIASQLYLTAQNRNLSLINRLWLIKMMSYLLISSLTTGLWRATPSGDCFVFTSCFFFHLSFRSSHFIAPISFNIFWFSKVFSVTSGSLPVWCYLTCVHHLLWFLSPLGPIFPI